MRCGKLFECFAVEQTWFEHVLSVGSMVSNYSKFRKQNSHGGGGELGKHCKAALEPFGGIQNMVELYGIYVLAFFCV